MNSRLPWSLFGIVLALLAGAGLRLIWPADIEYKADELWTFQHSHDTELPWLGMPSSVDIPNPGMSLWGFMLLQRLSGAEDPPALARAIQLLNIAALILLAGFAFLHVPRGEREPWLWAAALVAVNPLAVLFHRKIWPPCILPLLTLAMLYGWWYRQRRGPAFVWGLIGVCLGQIHMAGFFFAGGFVLWALLFDRPPHPNPPPQGGREKEGSLPPCGGGLGWGGRQRVAWRGWLLGSVLGALPMLPWLVHLLSHPSERPINPYRWVHACELKFWVRWATESFGLGINYTFGPYFRQFLRYPMLGGHPSYLVAVLHCLVAGLAVLLMIRAAVQLARQRPKWSELWIGRGSATAFTQSAALWGFGLLLTLSSFSIHRHYMIVLFPLEFLWVARLALQKDEGGRMKEEQKNAPASFSSLILHPSAFQGRALLLSLCCAQFLLSANMLSFIHTRQNFAGAEYGIPYGAQSAAR